MEPLEIWWTIFFIASIAAFFGVALIVSIKGIGDVKKFFRHLSKENKKYNRE